MNLLRNLIKTYLVTHNGSKHNVRLCLRNLLLNELVRILTISIYNLKVFQNKVTVLMTQRSQ